MGAKHYLYETAQEMFIIEIGGEDGLCIYDLVRKKVIGNLPEMSQEEFTQAIEPIKIKYARDIGARVADSVLRETREYAP